MKRKFLVFAFALVALAFLPTKGHAQSLSSYTLLTPTPITALTYVDSTCPDTVTCFYVVTATNGFGTGPVSNQVSGTIPATGTHTGTLTWPAISNATGYSVYQGQAPKAPVLTLVIN